MTDILRGTPVVCAVSDKYIICVPVQANALMVVNAGGKDYYCHSNGIRKSDVTVQKFIIPMAVLDEAGAYTVTYEAVIRRAPKVCEKEAPVSVSYEFKPLRKTDNINIYHISDVHGAKEAAINAGRYFKNNLDLLIINGDIASEISSEDNLLISLDIASKITAGKIPCIITRGNHDLRGKLAEKLENYIPTDSGRTYYTIKLGALWFLLLDCGEDKDDSHKEYSGTVCCHSFRLEQSEFIKDIISKSSSEYNAPGTLYRIILSHVPFNMDNNDECKNERPFNIERAVYSEWCKNIRENINPVFMLSGHTHTFEVLRRDAPGDDKHLGSDTILGGAPIKKNNVIIGALGTAITIKNGKALVRFTDDIGKVHKEETIDFVASDRN